MKEIYKVVKDLLINVKESDYDYELLASNYGEPLTSYYTMKCKAGDFIYVEDSKITDVDQLASYFTDYPYDNMSISKTYHLNGSIDIRDYTEPSDVDAVKLAVSQQIKLAESKREVEYQIETIDMGVYEIKQVLQENNLSKDNLYSQLKTITHDDNFIMFQDKNVDTYSIKMIPDLTFIATDEDVLISFDNQESIKTSDPNIIDVMDKFLDEHMDKLTNQLNKIESLASIHGQTNSIESSKEELEIDL